MKKEIRAYFGAFAKNSIFEDSFKCFNGDTTCDSHHNCEISYDDHCIEFTSKFGDKSNLKFKNEIEEVMPIHDGVLIKFNHSAEFEFFCKQSDVGSTQTKTSSPSKYLYYLISDHPLSNISTLSMLNSKQTGRDENLLNLNIIKTSPLFPFIVTQTSFKYEFFLLLHKEEKSTMDFNNYLEKIMNTADIFIGENFSNYTNESPYSLLYLSDFQFDTDFTCCDINIYTTFTEKKSIFFSFFDKVNNKVYTVQFKFKSGDLFSFSKTIHCFKSVLDFQLVNSLISTCNKEELFEKKRSTNKNIIVNYLKTKELYGVKNQNLVFLDFNFMLNYVESSNIVLKIDLANLLNIERSSRLHKFDIKHNTDFSVALDKGEEIPEYNFKLELQIKNEIILNYIKFITANVTKEIIYLLLENIFTIYYANLEWNCDQLEIFFDYLLLVFSNINSSSAIIMNNYENFSSFSEMFPILGNFNKFDSNYKLKISSGNLLFTTKSNYSLMKGLISKGIISYFQANKDKLTQSLVEFTRIYFETLKIKNFHSENSQILLNFLFKLLHLNKNEQLLIEYLRSIGNSYGLNSILINYTREINIINFLSDYKKSFTPFIEYLKTILIVPDEVNSNNSQIYPQIYFEFMKNLIFIIKLIRNKHLTNEYSNLNNQEMFLSTEYSLHLRKLNQESYPVSSNSLSAIINSGMEVSHIKLMHPVFSLVILEEISKYKINPYPMLTSDKKFNKKLLQLVERSDLVRNITETSGQSTNKTPNIEALEGSNNFSSLLYENQSSNYESDYYITNIKFDRDTRFKEALRILNPSRVIKVNTSSLFNHSDPNSYEMDKFNIMLKNLIRQYSTSIGAGAINVSTIKTFPKDILNIKPLNQTCISSTDESTFKLDNNTELLKDKDFVRWPEFHNGVSSALKLSTENFKNKSYIRNWILFNKPSNASFEHGGFLFGLGLLKQLDSLFSTDIYQYMKLAHDGITIGILLGRAASKISSMEESLSRTLCLHISYLIPSSLEINIPMNIQCAASVGLGLLYFGTGNRLMTDMLINQIGRKFNFDKSMSISHIESYNLCLGFAVGLINLGLGKMNLNEDLRLEEKLLNFANGGNKVDFSSGNNKHKDFSNRENKKTNQTFVEEFEVNVKLTAPAAYACLSLIYLQSGNTQLANRIQIPSNLYQLQSFRPVNLYLAILTKNLIIWDNIENSEVWLRSQIPEYIKFLYEEKLSTIEDDFTFSSKLKTIEFSEIAMCYFYALAAGIMSLGFKYAGSNNKQVTSLIHTFISRLKKVKPSSDIIVKDHTKYDDVNKFYLNKATLDQCLCISGYAVALVMAGSGDLESFKTLRVIRKKLESDARNFHYGYNQAIHHAIGILFLGGGALTFTQSKESLAFLFVSTFPVFASTTNCNEKYIQALRHLYVLSCYNKILETRDIDTGLVVRSNLEIVNVNGNTTEVATPVNIEDYSGFQLFKLKSDSHYYVEFNYEDLISTRMNNMSTKTIFIKKKNTFDSDTNKLLDKIPLLSLEDIEKYEDVIETMDEWLGKINIFFASKNVNKECINIKVLSSILDDQYKEMEKIGNNLLSKFQVILIKCRLVLLIDYLNKDKLNSFIILNDIIGNIDLSIKNDFNEKNKLFHYVRILFDIYDVISLMRIDTNITDILLLKETLGMVICYVIEQYKEDLKLLLTVLFKASEVSTNHNSFNTALTILSCFKLKLDHFNPNGGIIYELFSNIGIYMQNNPVEPRRMNDLISECLESSEMDNEISLDFQIYLMTTINSFDGEESSKLILHLIDLYLEIVTNK